MSNVIIIGGGFAGLRAGVALADQGVHVTVLESRPGLGGRARSFTDPAAGGIVDNGQHLFLSGYHETLQFLERLGTRQQINFQDQLHVEFVEPGGKVSVLDCPPVPGPWHLLLGILQLRSLSFADKLHFRNVAGEISKIPIGSQQHKQLDQITVQQWLDRLHQSPRSRAAFWDPLVIATLNEDPVQASAYGLLTVLHRILHDSWKDARLGMAAVGLSHLYTEEAQRVVEEKQGTVRVNCPVALLTADGSRITAVQLANGERLPVDQVICAVPPAALARILPPSLIAHDPQLQQLGRFTTSPIISINLWLDRPLTDALFVGFIGRRIQWLFKKDGYISLIISAASLLIDQSNDAIVAMALEDLRSCFPQAGEATVIRSQVVRERDATVSLTVGMESYRPGPRTSFHNLFLAGDWTNTGLPATIESAVVSGLNCAQAFLK